MEQLDLARWASFEVARDHVGTLAPTMTASAGVLADSAGMLADRELRPDEAPLILVVDDDEDLVGLTCGLLESAGYRVLSAANGLRALQLLAASSVADLPDLILLDLAMPVMDGYGFWAALRDDPAILHIPVIVSSGEERCVELDGVAGVLKKPYDADDLLRLVERHCH